jgi:hypothetical protein
MRICSLLTVLSSMMSISFMLAPNSRSLCSGSPYVSQGLCWATCAHRRPRKNEGN